MKQKPYTNSHVFGNNPFKKLIQVILITSQQKLSAERSYQSYKGGHGTYRNYCILSIPMAINDIITPIFALLFLSNSIAKCQEYPASLIKKHNIKSIKTYAYSIENGKEKEYGLSTSLIYDQKGNLLEKYETSKYTYTPRITYRYDSLGRLIEEIHFRQSGEKEKVSVRNYHPNGKLTGVDTSFWENKRYHIDEITFNSQQQITERKSYDEKEELIDKSTFAYFSSGELQEKVIESIRFNFTRIERFDPSGKLIYKSDNGKIDEFAIMLANYSFKEVTPSDTSFFIQDGQPLFRIEWKASTKKSSKHMMNGETHWFMKIQIRCKWAPESK